jgi:ParB family transcriptional regulator, chromosome partitioning protein
MGIKSKSQGRFRDGLSATDLLFGELSKPPEDLRAAFKGYEDGKLLRVKIDLIRSNPDQPRRYIDPDKLNELADTIKQKGLLQPLIVQIDENRDYTLIAGERRLLACKMAGVTRVPVIVKTGERAELALIENIQREDLNPVDEAEALNALMITHRCTQEEVASKVGKARSTVAETLSLNKLPQEIKEACRRSDSFSRRQLVEIAKQETREAMLNLFEQARKDGLKSDELRRITRNPGQEKNPAEPVKKMKSFNKFVQKIDPSIYDEEKKDEIATELNLLIENLKNMLDQLKGQAI